MDKNVYNQVYERSHEKCEICGLGGNLELHHILRRKVKENYHNCIMLCAECHRGTKGVHGRDGHILDMYLKYRLQSYYFLEDKPKKEIMALMGGHFIVE